MIRLVDIKSTKPNAESAVYFMDEAITDCTKLNEKILIVLHGYGSHGKGGTIKSLVQLELAKLQKYGKIKAYISGENWSNTSEECLSFIKVCPELIVNSQLSNYNPGITIILLS